MQQLSAQAQVAREAARQNNGEFGEQFRSDQGDVIGYGVLNLWGETGTFDYPPYPRSADQVIAFWSDVSIPDQAAAALLAAYRFRSAQVGLAGAVAAEKRVRERYGTKATPEMIEFERQKAQTAAMQQMNAKYPRLPLSWGPALVKVLRMDAHSMELPDHERAKIVNQQVMMPGDEHPRGTIGQLCTQFGLRELIDYAYSPDTSFALDVQVAEHFKA